MPGSDSVFPLWHISVTAILGGAASLALLWIWAKNSHTLLSRQAVAISLVVGFSILAWRLAGNVAQLNEDPMPLFSPNDLLCPVVTYVSLGVYAAFYSPPDRTRWERQRAVLTLVSLLVNVMVI